MKKRAPPQHPVHARTGLDNKQLRRASSGRRSSLAYSKQARHDTRPINDRNYQAASIRSLNSYLQFHGFPVTLSPKSLPSGKDVKDIITFLVHQLDPAWELGKLEDDVPMLFRHYGYPFQINKSALYAAGSPHSWPALLAGLSWLVQLLNYQEKVEDEGRDVLWDSLERSYDCYLRGDDNAMENVDRKFVAQMEEERDAAVQRTAAAETLAKELEAKVKDLKSGSAVIEDLNRNKGELAEDVRKFHFIINNLSTKKETLEMGLVKQRQELEGKNLETEKLTRDVEELKQRVDSQQVNARDFEKMNREYQRVEDDVRAAQEARNQWEEKAWELEVAAGKKLKELEGTIDRYNQEIVRLKLGSAFEYKLNSRGVTLREILGADFKAMIKPGIISSTEDYERNSREKWEESVTVQQKLHEKISELEKKRKVNKGLSVKIKKLEARYGDIRKGMDEYISSKEKECERLLTEVESNENGMKKKEAEADDCLKKARLELEEITKHYDEEIQICSNELFQMIETIAKHKEHVELKISKVKAAVSKATQEANNIYTQRNMKANLSD